MNENMLEKFEDFRNTPLNVKERSASQKSDELFLRKAKIYKCLGPEDDRLQVQVLPELQGIDESEMEDLPKYPPLIKGTVITGKNHVEDGDAADYVWCVCTPDLQVGYILGLSNIFGDPNIKYKDSYSFWDVKSFLGQRRVLPEKFNYNRIQVVNWFTGDDGGYIQCYDRSNGNWFLVNTSGTLITVQQKEIMMRCGSPPNPISAGPVAHSEIKMTPNNITITSPAVEFNSLDIKLGHSGMKVATTITEDVGIAANGIPFFANPAINVTI